MLQGLNWTVEALREHEAMYGESGHTFRHLIETAKDVIWTVDMDLNYTYVSPSVEPVLGYGVEEMMSMDPLDTLTSDSRKRMVAALSEELAQERKGDREPFTSRTEEVEQFHKDGSIRSMEITTTFLRGASGKPTGILGISRDITKRIQMEAVKTHFVSAAAHALRSPLTSVLGYAELLLIRDDLPPEEQRQCLSHIHEQAVELSHIVSNLIDLADMESGEEASVQPEHFDIGTLIDYLAELYRKTMTKHRFEVGLPEEPVVLVADRFKMDELFRTVLTSMVRLSPDGGLIGITTEELGDVYQFSITVREHGLREDRLKQIGDNLYRADTSNEARSGPGLGLTRVRYIVEARGGEVWVESEPGGGTTVRFTLPVRLPGDLRGGGRSEEDTDRG